MWAACLESRVLLRALSTACRGRPNFRSLHECCRRARLQEDEVPLESREPVAAGGQEDEPSWVKRGLISLWPPIIPPR